MKKYRRYPYRYCIQKVPSILAPILKKYRDTIGSNSNTEILTTWLLCITTSAKEVCLSTCLLATSRQLHADTAKQIFMKILQEMYLHMTKN